MSPRAISGIVQTVTDTWQGVTSAGVMAEWIAESTEVADASPTLGSPSIPVYKGDAFVPFGFEVQGDAVNFMQELGNLLVDGAEQLNATAQTTGSGSGQPTGIITALVAAAGNLAADHTGHACGARGGRYLRLAERASAQVPAAGILECESVDHQHVAPDGTTNGC